MASLQRFSPSLQEPEAVFRLVALFALGQIGAAGGAFAVHDFGEGLVEHPVSCFPDAEGKIGVFVVGANVVVVEPSQLAPQYERQHDRGTAAVVGVANIVVLRLAGIVAAAKVHGGAVRPNDAARFLQATILEVELCAD